ncbi:hypothetical protein, partial [Mesotoga prima]|uniref:hypothetical protein n=1 Tax=Mesotoga prima TaxID=1184387 RepID=UPI002C5815DE
LVPKGGSVLRAWPRSKTKSTMLNQIQTESHTVNRELGRVEEPFFDNCFVLALTTWNRKLATALSKDGSMIWDDVRRTALCSEQRVVAKRTVVLRAGF